MVGIALTHCHIIHGSFLFPTVPGAPGCQWQFASLSSVTVNWTSPQSSNGIIEAYHIRLLSLNGDTVIRSATVNVSVSASVSVSVQRRTLSGLQLSEYIPSKMSF